MTKSVAILGYGVSVHTYLAALNQYGWRKSFVDETWGINGLGHMFDCDRVFHMDDVRVQMARAEAGNEKIGAMMDWLRQYDRPVYTSQVVEGFPCLEEFPLEDVLNNLGFGYFNSTAAYAVAYAIHIGVEELWCFGMDFTYPSRASVEEGRGCVEFWLGKAHERGIKIGLPEETSLTDRLAGRPFYGYDAVEVRQFDEDGRRRVEFIPKELPTAEEIERRYDKMPRETVLARDENGVLGEYEVST